MLSKNLLKRSHDQVDDFKKKQKTSKTTNSFTANYYEPTIYIQPCSVEIFTNTKLRLIIPNLSHLDIFESLFKEQNGDEVLNLLITAGRNISKVGTKYCLALQSCVNNTIKGVFSVDIYHISHLNGKKVKVAYINSFSVIEERDTLLLKYIFLLEMLKQLKKLDVEYVFLDSLPKLVTEYTQLLRSFLFSDKHTYDSPLSKFSLHFSYKEHQISRLCQIEKSLTSIKNNSHSFPRREPGLSYSLINLPKRFFHFSSRSAYPIIKPTIANRFNYLSNCGLVLFIPNFDQLLPLSHLYIDGGITPNYVKKIINPDFIDDKGIEFFVYGIQEINSNKIIAAIYYQYDPVEKAGDIDSLKVIQEYQCKGLGALLLTAAIENLMMLQCQSIYLQTSADGRYLYCSYEFEPIDLKEESSEGESSSEEENEEENYLINRTEWRGYNNTQKLKYCNEYEVDEMYLDLHDNFILESLKHKSETLHLKILQKNMGDKLPKLTFTSYNQYSFFPPAHSGENCNTGPSHKIMEGFQLSKK